MILRWALWTAIVAGGLLALSILAPKLQRQLRVVRRAVRARSKIMKSRWFDQLRAGFKDLWSQQLSEARVSPTADLRRLAFTLERAASEPATHLRQLSTTVSSQLQQVSVLHREVEKAWPEASALEVPPESGREPSLTRFVVILVLILAVAGINVFLLKQFFDDVGIGAFPMLPYPLPEITASHLIAGMFVLLEVGSGMAIHLGRSDSEPTAGLDVPSVFLSVPWLVIAVLAFVEFIAYALLSQRIGIAIELGIEPGNPLYAPVDNFMALFGGVISLLLATMGYWLWREWHDFTRLASLKRRTAELKEYTESRSRLTQAVSSADESLEALITKWTSFRQDLTQNLEVAVGRPNSATEVAAAVRDELSKATSGSLPIVKSTRTSREVVTELLLNGLALILLAMAWYWNAAHVNQFLAEWHGTGEVVSRAGGWVLASLASVLAYLLRAAFTTSSAEVTTAAVPRLPERGRTALAVIACAGLLMIVAVSASVAVMTYRMGPSVWLNLAYGVALPLVLMLLALRLDDAVAAGVRLLHLGSVLVLLLVVSILIQLGYAVDLLLSLVGSLIAIASEPGRWIRRSTAGLLTARSTDSVSRD